MLDTKQKKSAILEKIEKTEKDILIGELLIGFYKSKLDETDSDAEKGTTEMKISQLEKTNEFNQGFVDFAEKELKNMK